MVPIQQLVISYGAWDYLVVKVMGFGAKSYDPKYLLCCLLALELEWLTLIASVFYYVKYLTS